ncbi:MAG: RNase adapter RapZ [Coriobacteriia bacterium]|nr:RNase adapter RapZ [Coriobacteriia bacterium]
MLEHEPHTQKHSQVHGNDLVIITGMSGAGKTETLRIFEDMGYYCIDNLPPAMLKALAELVDLGQSSGKKLAVVSDVRSQEFFAQFTDELQKVCELGIKYTIIFLEASNQSLRNRYSALRRRHPLAKDDMSITDAIKQERLMLASIKESASLIIDTTKIKTRDLKTLLIDSFAETSAQESMSVQVFSFGYKYGNPIEGEILMDVRFLPNPYYISELKELTGYDEAVRDYVLEKPQTQEFLDKWFDLLDVLMPSYVEEGKPHLSLGIGCTGGQHRSVVIAQKTAEYLRDLGYRVHLSHRDVQKAQR